MFIVRFIRKDDNPPEEYFYYHKKDAENHVEMFLDDDSGLYAQIYLLEEEDKGDMILRVVKL